MRRTALHIGSITVPTVEQLSLLRSLNTAVLTTSTLPQPGETWSGLPVLPLSELVRVEWSDIDVVIAAEPVDSAVLAALGMGFPPSQVFFLRHGTIHPCTPIAERMHSRHQDLTELRGKHRGSRGFILGNGPSLLVSDLHRLKKEITFASNKIYLAFDQTDWRPTYYTVVDHLVAVNNREMINSLDLFTVFPKNIQQYDISSQRGVWFTELYDNKVFERADEAVRLAFQGFFSREITFGIQGGHTVIYNQLQLARYLGITEVYLLGVDFHFTLPKVTVDERFSSNAYRHSLESAGEQNHFHPDYRKPGEKWAVPRLDVQQQMFKSAGSVFRSEGGAILNASRATRLEEFPKVSLDEILAAGSDA